MCLLTCILGRGCVGVWVCIVCDCCEWWHLRQFCLTLALHTYTHTHTQRERERERERETHRTWLLCWPTEVIRASFPASGSAFIAWALSHNAVIQQNASGSLFPLKGLLSNSSADGHWWGELLVSCGVGLQLSVCCTSWARQTQGGGAQVSATLRRPWELQPAKYWLGQPNNGREESWLSYSPLSLLPLMIM